MKTPILTVMMCALAACGSPEHRGTPDPVGAAYVGIFHGAEVYLEAESAVSLADIERAVHRGLTYWSAADGALDGWRVFFAPRDQVCQDIQTSVTGCCEWNEHRITAAPIDGCATAVGAHEIGHALIGDPGHLDPRWSGAESVTLCD